MPRAGSSAVEIAFFGGAASAVAPRCARDVGPARCQCAKDRIQAFRNISFAPDHETVTALQSPNAAAGAGIEVIDFFRPQHCCAAHVVFVVGITAIYNNVARLHAVGQRSDCLLGGVSRRQHQPNNTRGSEGAKQVHERRRTPSTFGTELFYGRAIDVKHHTFMASTHQPPGHVAAHAS